MFFSLDLLIPQHGGKFALAWLAATRGIGYTKKKDIIACDIGKLCKEILAMVQASSTRPRLRLSLSLASRLINGVARIYKFQIEIFQGEILTFLTIVRNPNIGLSKDESEATPVTPITRPQRKRRRKSRKLSQNPEFEAPNPQYCTTIREITEEELLRPSAFQRDPDLITLREEVPIYHNQTGLVMVEEQFQEFPSMHQDSLPPLDIPEIDFEKNLPKARIMKPTSVSENQVIADISLHHEPQLAAEVPEVQVVPGADAEHIDIPQEQSQIVPELVVQQASDNDGQQVPSVTTRIKKTHLTDKLACKPLMKQYFTIDRCFPGEIEYFSLEDFSNRIPVQLINARSNNIYNLLNYSMVRVEDILREAPLSAKSRESLLRSSALFQSNLARQRISVVQDSTPVPDIQVMSTIPQEAHQIVTKADVHVNATHEDYLQQKQIIDPQHPSDIAERFEVAERTVQALAESTPVEPFYIHEQVPIHPPECTIEIELPPAAEAQPRKEAMIKISNEAGKRKMLTKDRQKRIRNIVKNWPTTGAPITITDVCMKPVNRLNVAKAFGDLLSLHKKCYVELENKPNSLELGCIKKGERILKKK